MKRRFVSLATLLTLLVPLTGMAATEPSAGMPDLVPTIVSFNRSSRSPSATVVNQGNVALSTTASFVVRFTLFDTNGDRIGSAMTQPLQSVYRGLASGRGAFFQYNAYNQLTEEQASRVASVTAVVDTSNTIEESAEDNNEKTAAIVGAVETQPDGAMPDLVVTGATLDRATRQVRVTVANEGTWDIPKNDQYGVHVELLDDTGTVITSVTDVGPDRPDGLPRTKSEQLYTFLKPSQEQVNLTAKLRATVDSGNGTAETNEENNTFTADVPGEHGYPDLVITSASFNRSSRFTSVSVKNIGTLTAPTSQAFTVRVEYLDENGDVVATAGAGSAGAVGALTPGGSSYPLQRFSPQPSVAQAERIVGVRAIVDPGQTVTESNEDNNIYPLPTPPVVEVPVPPIDTPDIEPPVTTEEVAAAETQIGGGGTVGLLPTSRLYFLKNIAREVRAALTFDKEKKVELRRQYTNEKLLELRAIEKTATPEVVEKQVARLKKDMEKVAATLKSIEEKNTELAERIKEKMKAEAEAQQVILRALEEKAQKDNPVKAVLYGEVLGEVGVKKVDVRNEIKQKMEERKPEPTFEERLVEPMVPEVKPTPSVRETPKPVVPTPAPVETPKKKPETAVPAPAVKEPAVIKAVPKLPMEHDRTVKEVPAPVKVVPTTSVSCETEGFAPVCGTDGKTYDNVCLAKKVGTAVKNDGPCTSDTSLHDTTTYPSVVEVKIGADGFSSSFITLARGGKILFTNADSVAHTIAGGNTGEVTVQPGMSASVLFADRKGTYTIFSREKTSFSASVTTY